MPARRRKQPTKAGPAVVAFGEGARGDEARRAASGEEPGSAQEEVADVVGVARCAVPGHEPLVEQHPLEQGLSELVAYMTLAAEDERAVIDEASEQVVFFGDDDGRSKRARIPKVVFTRGETP